MRMKVSINDIVIGKMQGEDVIIIKSVDLINDDGTFFRKAKINEKLVELIKEELSSFDTNPAENRINKLHYMSNKNPLVIDLVKNLKLKIC